MRNIRGVTLTNLLIGLGLGLTISAGVIQGLYSQKKTYSFSEKDFGITFML